MAGAAGARDGCGRMRPARRRRCCGVARGGGRGRAGRRAAARCRRGARAGARRRVVRGTSRGSSATSRAGWIPAPGGGRGVHRPLRGAAGRCAPAPAVAPRPGAPARSRAPGRHGCGRGLRPPADGDRDGPPGGRADRADRLRRDRGSRRRHRGRGDGDDPRRQGRAPPRGVGHLPGHGHARRGGRRDRRRPVAELRSEPLLHDPRAHDRAHVERGGISPRRTGSSSRSRSSPARPPTCGSSARCAAWTSWPSARAPPGTSTPGRSGWCPASTTRDWSW